jgi:ankyrin repeat protein
MTFLSTKYLDFFNQINESIQDSKRWLEKRFMTDKLSKPIESLKSDKSLVDFFNSSKQSDETFPDISILDKIESSGLKTGFELIRSNPQELATKVGISQDQMVKIIDSLKKPTDEERRNIDSNKAFAKIKDICKSKQGWTYFFLRLYMDKYGYNGSEVKSEEEETEKLNQLESLYKEIESLGKQATELGPEVNGTKLPFEKWLEVVPTEEDHRNIPERIVDAIEVVKFSNNFTKFYNQFMKFQKEQIDRATKTQLERLKNIANAFYTELGWDVDENGKKILDVERQYSDFRVFFSKCKDLKTLDDIIDYASRYLKSVSNAKISKFLEQINKINTKLDTPSVKNGAQILFIEDSNLVIEVFSYAANSVINAHTNHCIAKYLHYWNQYLQDYNRQFYVYNFSLDSEDPLCVIGLTVKPDGSYADLKNKLNSEVRDGSLSGREAFKSLMSKSNIPMDLFKPMSKEEIEIKRRKIEASKNIVRKELSIEDVTKYLDEGADPNADGGEPLKNAVEKNDLEIVKLLLSRGAIANIKKDERSPVPIDFAKSLDMIRLLVENGSTPSPRLIRDLYQNSDTSEATKVVKFFLDDGLDPSYDRGYLLRKSIQYGDLESVKLFFKYSQNIKEDDMPNTEGKKVSLEDKKSYLLNIRRNTALTAAAEFGKKDILIFLLDQMKQLNNEKVVDPTESHEFENTLIDSVNYSDLNDAESKDLIATIKRWFSDNTSSSTVKESRRFLSYRNFNY